MCLSALLFYRIFISHGICRKKTTVNSVTINGLWNGLSSDFKIVYGNIKFNRKDSDTSRTEGVGKNIRWKGPMTTPLDDENRKIFKRRGQNNPFQQRILNRRTSLYLLRPLTNVSIKSRGNGIGTSITHHSKEGTLRLRTFPLFI